MADKKKNAPLPASSAGLLRFFEDETKGFKIENCHFYANKHHYSILGYRSSSNSINIMSDSKDIQNIHKRYSFTLINPSSFYVSLTASIAIASIISFLSFNNYIQNYEILYHLPAVVAALLATQYFDSRFTRHKEYSKSLHMSFFGNTLWLITIVSGIIGSAILSKELSLFYVAVGMFIFSSFRIGIMTT